jgi:hypothetical protein
MHHVLIIIAAIVGVSSAFAGGIETNIPVSLADNPKEFWRVFMTSFYGPYDSNRKCWVVLSEGSRYCMRPHTLNKSADKYFITAAGAVTDREGGNDCHACNGNIGFFVLEPNGTNFKVTAQGDRLLNIGVYGKAPAEDKVSLRAISSNGSTGWMVETFDFGQGISVEFYQVKGIVGDQVRTLGTLPKLFSDTETDCGNTCTEIAIEATFDTAKPDPFAPVILRAEGTFKGEAFTKTFTAVFDQTEFKYRLPDDMPNVLKD